VEILWDRDVTPGVLAEYDAVVLGNVPCLRDSQRRALGNFVAAGGGLYADFESGMYDERSRLTADDEWLALLGVASVDGMFTPSRAEDYLRITDAASPLASLRRGQLFPRPIHILRVQPRAGARVPALVLAPLGKSYMVPQGDTDCPGLVLRGFGEGRVAYSPGALAAAFHTVGMPPFEQLIEALVRWVMKDAHPLRVGAPKSVYVEWRKQAPHTDLIHLVNNTADMHRPVGEFVPVRDLTVELVRQHCSRVRSLRLEMDLPHILRDGVLAITVPVLEHYDVVAIE
jgi:hypothetical protein